MLNSFCTEEQRFVHLSLNIHRVEFCSEITSYVAKIFQSANLNTQHASQEKKRRVCYRKLFKIGIFFNLIEFIFIKMVYQVVNIVYECCV